MRQKRTPVIYRVEDCEGIGPFVSALGRHLPDWLDGSSRSSKNIPNTVENKLTRSKMENGVHIFGCRSLKRLCKYFTSLEREKLHKLGFHIGVYYAADEDVWHLKNQCFFTKSEAVKLATFPLIKKA